jgi:hypothetical protein
VPTSVLLAVLAAAGLLALAPALVRRYDATERLVAERALSTARVLARAGIQTHRRRRTVPGRRPVNPPRVVAARMPPAATPVASPTGRARMGTPRRLPHSRAVYRRRRVFAALVLLNVVELVGVGFVGPGFWISAGVTGAMFVGYLVHLRNQAILEHRRHRAAARYATWVAARQAAVRREQARRVAARRELLRQQLLEREQARREAAKVAARSAVRGRPYEARAVGQDW